MQKGSYMKIPKNDINNFIADKAYYKSASNYCLGKTLEEAGKIARQLAMATTNREKSNGRTKTNEE